MDPHFTKHLKLYGCKAYVREISPPPKIAENQVQEILSSILDTTEMFGDH